jgi:hypothetical protein
LEEVVPEETIPVEEFLPQRVNPFCVISKNTFGEYAVRDIQTNSAWSANPYEDYAVVPDDMVLDIMETRGFCDIVLNEDGTEVVSFTALVIPVIPVEEAEPTTDDIVNALCLALEKGWGHGWIQIGPSECTSIREIAETVVKISGKEIDIFYDTTKPEGDKARSADWTKAKEVLGWEPKMSLKEGLQQQYDWIKAQIEKQ